MNSRKHRPQKRGFTLLIVVVVMALVAFIGSMVLSVINTEQKVLNLVRLAKEARSGAEAATMEVLNDQQLPSMLPGYATNQLLSTYTLSPGTGFSRDATPGLSELRYEASISLIRDVPVRESSLSVTRAFLYEVRVETEVADGSASDEVHAQIFKVFTMPAGVVLPDNHAR